MMRIELNESAQTVTMRIQGRFVGKFAEDAKRTIVDCKFPSKLLVNLTDVSFVDQSGEEVLLWFEQIGGEFIAENAYSLNVCERLHLPMNGKIKRKTL